MTSIATDRIVKQLEALLSRYHAALQLFLPAPLPTSKRMELLASSQAAIERLAPPNSPYLLYSKQVEDANEDYRLESLVGIVEALKHDYKLGALDPIQELIRAEVFDDFLEMAEHLLNNGYKDPAAVLAGSVLEQHLRKLCEHATIPLESGGKSKKADTLNAELSGQGVYGKLDLKSVTSWLDLRNNAAHGNYAQYTSEQVRIQLLGIRDFTRRTRA